MKKIVASFLFASLALAEPISLSMTREASGTSWQPDASPMDMIMFDKGPYQFMVHGNIFVGGDFQSSSRGDMAFTSMNWIMLAASRSFGPHDISARVMLSAEPWTVPQNGYPLLFQTGETWKGEPLHDHQHPHDLFMELAATYTWAFSDNYAAQVYLAASGEPALGPVAFSHRNSARSNPFAPLSHHWLDSTHISFGVLTIGVFCDAWKLEGSWFNGREPDENRADFDFGPFDSYAARFTYNANKNLVAQASYGFLKSPEAHEPNISVHRLTSSVLVDYAPFKSGRLAGALMAGLNIPSAGKNTTLFGLAEANLDFARYHTAFGRFEVGVKTGDELVLAPILASTEFPIAAVSLGYKFRFPQLWELSPAVGGVFTLNFTNPQLGAYYGSSTPFGGMVFAQLST